MQTITRTLSLPYDPAALFALVADIEQYPQFLPHCEAARIHWEKAGRLEASVHVNYKGLRYAFSTQNENLPPTLIRMSLSQGPFKTLKGEWRFEADDSITHIHLHLSVAFKNKLMQMALQRKLSEATDMLVEAFKARAHHLLREEGR